MYKFLQIGGVIGFYERFTGFKIDIVQHDALSHFGFFYSQFQFYIQSRAAVQSFGANLLNVRNIIRFFSHHGKITFGFQLSQESSIARFTLFSGQTFFSQV